MRSPKSNRRGQRPHPSPGNGGYNRGYHRSDGSMGDHDRRKRDLKLFFELRDRKFGSIIEELFRLYHFQDIAKGLHRKYKLLPRGWKSDLEQLKRMDDPKLSWFRPDRVHYLDETTDNYPAVDKKLRFPDRGGNKAEMVVDEFIQHEKVYFDKLNTFLTSYVAEVEAIAKDKVGPQAKDALGLNQKQVDYIFGKRLQKVFHAVESLLVVLETLSLVQADPLIPGGRPGHLADIIILSGMSLVQAYAPYNAHYQVARKVLEKKGAEVAGKPAATNNAMRHLNFSELWAEISQAKPPLRQLSIDSVLVLPIRRFPNYKLFFERILKVGGPDHPARARVSEALVKIQEFTLMIDEEVKKQTSIEDTFFQQLIEH